MKFSIHKIRALHYSISFDTPRSLAKKGYWIEFKYFSLIITLKSKTIIWEI